MPIVVTGATGQLGGLIVEQLLARGCSADEIVATGRDRAKLAVLSDRLGVRTRQADLADPASLTAAFAGADTLMLVSTTDLGDRLDNHRRAIDAASAAGVGLIVYTSAVNADTARMRLAVPHRQTEYYLRAGGVPFVILRNGWYLENYTEQLPTILEHRTLFGAAGAGRVAAACRLDYAAAAAAVLTQDGHAGATYELGGEAFTLGQLAETITNISGTPVSYQDLAEADYATALARAGLPVGLAQVLADADAGLARGELFTDSDDLARLIGRPPTTRQQAVRQVCHAGALG